jgi:hypothetical protein
VVGQTVRHVQPEDRAHPAASDRHDTGATFCSVVSPVSALPVGALTGHTADDQAETVFLNRLYALMRGWRGRIDATR